MLPIYFKMILCLIHMVSKLLKDIFRHNISYDTFDIFIPLYVIHPIYLYNYFILLFFNEFNLKFQHDLN